MRKARRSPIHLPGARAHRTRRGSVPPAPFSRRWRPGALQGGENYRVGVSQRERGRAATGERALEWEREGGRGLVRRKRRKQQRPARRRPVAASAPRRVLGVGEGRPGPTRHCASRARGAPHPNGGRRRRGGLTPRAPEGGRERGRPGPPPSPGRDSLFGLPRASRPLPKDLRQRPRAPS
jgi:hypothetical protein